MVIGFAPAQSSRKFVTSHPMDRKAVPPNAQATVLLRSRRRCCICFGLNRDTLIKQGQIAHLDGVVKNNSESNLAFLCFDHHDQYDSTTRISKNFTREEVMGFREELYQAIRLAFTLEASFSEAGTAPPDRASGHYIRMGNFDSAELRILLMANGHYHITGLALWGEGRGAGPHLGELDFVAPLCRNVIKHLETHPGGSSYRATLNFSDQGLTVIEERIGVNFIFGANVTFCGKYTKAT